MATTLHCRHCGESLSPDAVACMHCGVMRGRGEEYCWNCAARTGPSAATCLSCGGDLRSRGPAPTTLPMTGGRKSKMTAALLGILVGGFGIHRFYLGYTAIGIIQIIVTICTFGFGAIWGFVEGILILVDKIRVDAKGVPLAE